MVINMLAAALAGILIPLLLDRFGADPAISSSVFTTMVTDVIGFLAFLGLATWWLDSAEVRWRCASGLSAGPTGLN